MKKNLNSLFTVLIIAAVAYGYAVYKKNNLSGHFFKSDYGGKVVAKDLGFTDLPQFDAKRLDNGNLVASSSIINGKEFIVHFFASWCAPCLEELPQLIEYAGKKRQKSFWLIASRDKLKPLRKLISKYTLPENVVVLLDPDVSIMQKFGSERLPESFFFTSEGKVDFKAEGPWNWR